MKPRNASAIVIAVLLAVGTGAPVAQGAGQIQGTYSMHMAGQVTPADFDGTPADASWSVATLVSAKNGQGLLHAKLLSASHGPFVQNCAEDASHGTITTQMSGVIDPSATFRFLLSLDLLHNRGIVDAYAGPYEFGTSDAVTEMACDADYGGSSEARQDYPVASAFSAVTRPDPWKVRKTGTNRWVAAGTQQLRPPPGPGDNGPSTATLNLTITGSPTALHAACRLPTPRDLAKARTRAAALRILRRAGLHADPSLKSLSVGYVKKGHFFVNDWAVDHYGICGQSAQLVLSTGPSSGGGGHGGA